MDNKKAKIALKIVGWTLTVLSILVFGYFCILIRPIDAVGIWYFLVAITGIIVGVWIISLSRKSYVEYKGFWGDIKYVKADKMYHGRVTNRSSDFLYYEGETIKETEEAFREVVDKYIESEKEAV